MRRTIVLLAVAMITASLVPIASAQEDDDRVVLRVGLGQDWDSLNPMVGYLVSEFEVWVLQYAGLTTLDENYEVVPDLAESWESSEDGLTHTYTLREGLQWSDGEPITSEDVVWTIESANEQAWWNHYTTTLNLTAVALDERTVEITSSVPDPKLPDMGIFIMPKHIWEPYAPPCDPDLPEECGIPVTEYDGLDGVGSGPYVLKEDGFQDQQSVTMIANPNYWGWEGEEPPIDEIIFRYFANPDAIVAALQRGEIDAAQDLPASAMESLDADPNIVALSGLQGGFNQIGINGGAGAEQPHPAVLDLEVRRAIAHGIDTEAVVEDLWFGNAEVLDAWSPSADPKWIPEIPEENQFTYDPDVANQILDEAGYMDTDGDGVREMPDGSDPLVLRHLVNTNTDLGTQIGDLFIGWMEAIGIGVELVTGDSDQTTAALETGEYDTFYWGWSPGVDPDGMVESFITDEVGVWNDANWSNERYDELYELQKVELDEDARVEMIHEMLTIMHDDAIYLGVVLAPELQAYRTDAFEGWVRQLPDVGPVMFSMSSPSYTQLTPVGGGGSSDGGSDVNWLLIGSIGAAVVVAGVLIGIRRGKSADDRE